MVNILKRMRKLNKLLTIRNGPGAAILPQTQDPQTYPQITRIHLAFPLRRGDRVSTGARHFWRQHLRRLKYHNPGLPITVQHDKTQEKHPRNLTIFWSDRPPKKVPEGDKGVTAAPAAGKTEPERDLELTEEGVDRIAEIEAKSAGLETELQAATDVFKELKVDVAISPSSSSSARPETKSHSEPSQPAEVTSESPPPSSPTQPAGTLHSTTPLPSSSSTSSDPSPPPPNPKATPNPVPNQDQDPDPDKDQTSSATTSTTGATHPDPSSPQSHATQTLRISGLSSRRIWSWLAFLTDAVPVPTSDSDKQLMRDLQSFGAKAQVDRERVKEGVDRMRREEEMRRRAREEAARITGQV